MLEALLVCRPLAREEDEPVEHHAPAKYWYVFERLLEDDVQVAVHRSGITCPPYVDPISVNLNVRQL